MESTIGVKNSRMGSHPIHRGIIPLLLLLAGAQVTLGAADQAAPPAKTAEPSGESYETLESFYGLYQPYVNNISAYEPIYFLAGTDLAESKAQFSFKYRLLNTDGRLVGKYPWLGGWHFGYTQSMFWDLEAKSLPFEDTSYKPEIFHLSRNLLNGRPSPRGFFFKSGLFHESNGKSEGASRSINTVYAQPVLVLYDPGSRYGLSVGPKVWAYVSTGDQNSDIADYRGYFEVDLKVGKADGLVVSSLFGWAKEGGSVQLDLTYPVGEWLFNNIHLYLHFQYVNALAENLLYYEERTKAYRLGVSFVR